MASLDMSNSSYKLTKTEIDNQVTRTSAGNYALGYRNDEGTFIVKYVGRSDTDLNARLKQHANTGKFPRFKYSYATSPKAAFEKECKNFHDFGGTSKLNNDIHPDRPKNSNWKCSGCDIDIFDLRPFRAILTATAAFLLFPDCLNSRLFKIREQ